MNSLYSVVLVTQKSNLDYDYSKYKELRAKDEEDAIRRWSILMNISIKGISKVSEGQWICNGNRINVELA